MNWNEFKQKYLVTFWAPFPAVIALGILSAYYFGLSGTYWAVTGEFTRWGGHILQFFGFNVEQWGYFKIIGISGNPLSRIDGVMIIGMFGGALAVSFWANNIKLRMPQSKIRVAQALIGGIIAGFGARIGMGCNLASFFTGIPQFSLHAWFFTISMIIGVYAGTKVILLPFLQSKIQVKKTNKAHHLEDPKNKAKIFFRIGSVVFVAMTLWCVYLIFSPDSDKSSILGVAMLFGMSFGIIIARAQICFTSAFRDLFMTGRSNMSKAVIIAMAISTIGVFSYIMLGVNPKIMWAGPNAIIGGLLFGFGIVIAGGCECGWMYRALEGQVHYWIVGVGNVIGSTLVAITWDSYADKLATNFPKINLLESFGNYGGLFVNYFLLMLFFVFVLFIQKNKLKGIA